MYFKSVCAVNKFIYISLQRVITKSLKDDNLVTFKWNFTDHHLQTTMQPNIEKIFKTKFIHCNFFLPVTVFYIQDAGATKPQWFMFSRKYNFHELFNVPKLDLCPRRVVNIWTCVFSLEPQGVSTLLETSFYFTIKH